MFAYEIQNYFNLLPFSYGADCKNWPLDDASAHQGAWPRILGMLGQNGYTVIIRWIPGYRRILGNEAAH